MNITDPIADLLTRIRNAQTARLATCTVPASKMKIAIAHILKEEGFITNYKCIRDRKQGILKIALKYHNRAGVIQDIKRVSKPSCRRHMKVDDIPTVKNGYGIGILSTSKGILTDKEARQQRVGGEYICSVF